MISTPFRSPASSRIAYKQLLTVAPKPALRPNVRPSPFSISHPIGLRLQSTSSPARDEVKLDWNSFFKLRASRRRYSLASSIASSLVTTTVGVQILSSQDLESLGSQVMGLDPFVVLGLATAACGALGWLVGPIVGNGLWGLVYRRFTPSVAIVSSLVQAMLLTISILTLPAQFRKKRSSMIGFAASVWTLRPTPSLTQFRITTARRSVVCKDIDSGLRTNGHTTASVATSLRKPLGKWSFSSFV